jgi:Domain of unknown function (DUF4129)
MAPWGRPAVVLLMGVAVIVAAMAAAGDPLRVRSGRSTEVGDVPGWLLLIPLLGVVLAAIGLVALVREGHGPKRSMPRRSIIPTLAAIAFAALIASLIGRPSDDRAADEPEPVAIETAAPAPDDPGARPSWPTWSIVTVAGVIAIAAAVARLRGPGRAGPEDRTASPADGSDDDAHAAPAAATLRGSVSELYAEQDPRRGVIAAYARLLDGLGGAGVARRVDEAPFEHVTRALRGLGVRREPLERLAVLFAEARFSTHPITERHRQEAMTCLRASLDDLGAVPCG